MTYILNSKTASALVIIIVLLLVVIGAQLLYIKFNGKPVPIPDIPRSEQRFGSGSNLNYVVIGDSTGVGQGAQYENGIAVGTAQYLARYYDVSLTNYAVSGATTNDVLKNQVEEAVKVKPDIVLIAVGANDVTRLTSLDRVEDDMISIIVKLRKGNPDVMILLTGSPQMGSVSRFPWPINYLARLRTQQINTVLQAVSGDKNTVLSPLAEKTGPIFDTNPKLFAQDNFHPNDDGYEVWTPVLNTELENLLESRLNTVE